MTLTARELDILQKTSRFSSALSLIGTTVIIVTFCTSKSFSSRPITRLVFYASFGNILTNVATILSRDGIRAGQTSNLCQAQALIIQWAIPADAIFCFAMAFNVYLTVCRKRTTQQLRKLEPFYVGICYGVTLIPALVFLLMRPEKGMIYGDATLWCWISNDWHVLRVASFYGPVWIVLFITFFIYLFCGRIIFNLRRKLRVFARANQLHHLGPNEHPELRLTSSSPSSSATQTASRIQTASPPLSERKPVLLPLNKIVVRKTVDTEVMTTESPLDSRQSARHSIGTPSQEASYICTITTANYDRDNDQPLSRTGTSTAGLGNGSMRSVVNPRHQRTVEANTAAWAYIRNIFIFLNLEQHSNNIFRCAFLFFVALFITWLPSSINRVYQLQHPDRNSFPMLFAAALVLPLQGFWNGLIYIVTTLPAVHHYIADVSQCFSEVSESISNKAARYRSRSHQNQHQYHQHLQDRSSQPGSLMSTNPSGESLPLYQPITVTQPRR